ncbi:MAG: hypothetical protein J5911_05600 [Clostridia bacterium]|nr:hypothetical protein [Clostridia bacterium]
MREHLHEGHRERVINKFIEFPNSFNDHELLEIFLFAVYPRKDTNEIAHRLIAAFGSINNVFTADAERLMTVKGVGKAVAAQIVLHAKLMQRIAEEKKSEESAAFTSFDKTKKEVTALFDGLKGESFYFFLLDAAFKSVFRLEYFGHSDEVLTDTAEIARAMSLHKAKFALMAHNHPSGKTEPSDADDLATKKFIILCDLHGVKLIDHVIVAGEEVFSYFSSGRLNYIKEKIVFNKTI